MTTLAAHQDALTVGALVILAIMLSGCGGSGGGVTVPPVAPAKVFSLAGSRPARPVVAGRPTTVSFTIRQPSGAPLTRYRTCCDPHAGVDLIIVRSDDSHLQYDDTKIAADGKISQPVVFPTPGRYRIIVNAYPKQSGASSPFGAYNFQLFTWVTVSGSYRPQPLPGYTATQTIDGYRFHIEGRPHLKAVQADFLTINVLDSAGHKAPFAVWHGALAHAIFIHAGSLDYFHTHVCSPGAIYCASVLGAARVTGTSSTPGQLRVGVLLPEPGTWRMFLITYINGHHITTPFILKAS